MKHKNAVTKFTPQMYEPIPQEEPQFFACNRLRKYNTIQKNVNINNKHIIIQNDFETLEDLIRKIQIVLGNGNERKEAERINLAWTLILLHRKVRLAVKHKNAVTKFTRPVHEPIPQEEPTSSPATA